MFDPIESGCKKKLVATSWAVVVLEDRMVNCEMPKEPRNNQTTELTSQGRKAHLEERDSLAIESQQHRTQLRVPELVLKTFALQKPRV